MSASVASDRSSVRRRGTMLSYIFANQGWGSLVGSIVTMIVLLCYKHVMQDEGETSKVDGVWRIVVALSLIPAFGTLYQRLTLPEARRFEAARKLNDEDEELQREKRAMHGDVEEKKGSAVVTETQPHSGSTTPTSPSKPNARPNGVSNEQVIEQEMGVGAKELARRRGSHMHDFIRYMSEWRHFKILLGTSMCWFLLDIAFYGINLNQNVVLQQIGFDGSEGTPWTKLFKIATGQLIITALGFVPGKHFSVRNWEDGI